MAHLRVTSTGSPNSFSNRGTAGSTPGKTCGFFEVWTAGLIGMACVPLRWMKASSLRLRVIAPGEDAVSSQAAVRC